MGINSVVIVGRITKDPELQTTKSGLSVCKVMVAVDNPGKDKSTSFLPVVAWKQTAEAVCKYCHKGSLVGVDGRISERSYESKEGKNNIIIEIVANSVEFLEPKKAEAGQAPAEAKIDVSEDKDLPF